jgi:hypothetical protein
MSWNCSWPLPSLSNFCISEADSRRPWPAAISAFLIVVMRYATVGGASRLYRRMFFVSGSPGTNVCCPHPGQPVTEQQHHTGRSDNRLPA